jgi:DedD protein
MDRALKERIIGAAVLVIMAILVVPVFLDGPDDGAEMITESVTLPGQNNQERKQQTIVLDRDRTEPVPAAAAPTPTVQKKSAPDKEPAAVQKPPEKAAPATSPDKTVAATSTTESSTGMWAVQLGSFSNQQNAERLAADLREQGFAAFLSQLKTDSGALHRVRIGPQKDRDSAETVAAKLGSAGHKGQVVPHP